MCVGVSPSGTNHVTPKCYVDAQITANAGGVCCVQTLTMCLESGTGVNTYFVTAAITNVNCNASWAFGESQQRFMHGSASFAVVIVCSGCCVFACRANDCAPCTQCIRVNVIASS